MHDPLGDLIERLQNEHEPQPPPLEEPPEFAFSRDISVCNPPARQRHMRPDLDEARAMIGREMRAYLAEPEPEHMLLIKSSPGTGKTTIAVDVAHEVAERRHKRVLYAAPRHDFYKQIMKAVAFNGRDPSLWYEWLPRQAENPETCIHYEAINKWMQKGYPAMDFCSGICGWDYVNGKCPYHAQKRCGKPLIMGQHQHVSLGHPLGFDIVLGDELPVGAFTNHREIKAGDLIPQTLAYESDMQPLLRNLLPMVVSKEYQEGHDFYATERTLGLGTPEDVYQICRTYGAPLDATAMFEKPRSERDAEDADVFYLHQLAYLLGHEAKLAMEGKDYPHRVLAGDGKLHMLMKRRVNERMPPHIVWMDATGNKRVYEALFQREVRVIDAAPQLHGRIYQIYDRANGKSSLVEEIAPKQTRPTSKVEQTRQLIDIIVERVGYESPVVITFKDIEGEFGYTADHFYGARGTNDYKDCDAAFIVGAPIPAIQALKREGAMIFSTREVPFDVAWHSAMRKYRYTDDDGRGREYPVGGYWGDADLESLMRLHREDEILQAAHRVRPILSDKDIWLFTNVPIDDLGPDYLLSMRDIFGVAGIPIPEGVNIFKWGDVYQQIDGMKIITTKTLTDLGLSRKTAYKYLDMLAETEQWQRAVVSSGPGRGHMHTLERREDA